MFSSIKIVTKSFREVLAVANKDKLIILLSLIPIIVGLILYALLGTWFFTDVWEYAKVFIEDRLGAGNLSGILSYLALAVISITLFFIINWTFVLFVSLMASPINDIISERAEKALLGVANEELLSHLKKKMGGIKFILINESKKLAFIMAITLFAFVLGLIPILSPISFILTALMFSVQFIDYSWSRHNQSFKECFADLRGNLLIYLGSGGIFLFIMSLPIINLFAFPFAVIYFTIVHHRANEKGL
ncbi:MAG: hypothetical protein A2504_05130 [Bdellovibrionales bacterium RIFOXYD12_FULL_39_22]|nr:MAG: hypothetical protein A2385_06695 [Bdellovibrionales bacterium RIFOXYB1_FULL_39_21]OFZ41959.1 MAG: hypothetical protein A2485_08665 [Bdellovibrionales bacterium RIFOXYC12_FULL_39_17]OFZ50675.1 MAG: hypothetical protein A2404_05615 [Bdellovibrionales bacterium RIFOXYC1_FULL_39_130]OFZ74038.1 MAG: hypothetical protein A2451_16935 [Bdellovibrionales bacterium RIFOXYC2_FULL_39_8]OFZ77898.1 MAG: hypothetical protein A2560_00785 [Bdellovibrionales bacterium RIFOXYD1_FULL_39_84]OFZ93666.1 MAG: